MSSTAHSAMKVRRRVVAVLLAAALVGAGCGSETGEEEPAAMDAPASTEFPKPDGRTTEELFAANGPTDELVVSPTGQVFREGKNRFGLGVFDLGREQITDAEVAIYAGPPDEPASGPYSARVESLATEPEYTAETTAGDPDSAQAVYVSEVKFNRPGEWRVIAMIRDGEALKTVRIPSIEVGSYPEVPAPGERAPRVHTPTVDDVASLDAIDTRDPHDTMHEVDFADVLGEKPTVLLFATPLLCVSRVCGPVVDVAEQVSAEYGDDVAFVHMEIYEDNEVDKGLRAQVKAFGLETEPWLFVVDAEGRVTEAIEGAFSSRELEEAISSRAISPLSRGSTSASSRTPIGGAILIAMGVLVYTDELFRLDIEVQQFLDRWGLNFFQSV